MESVLKLKHNKILINKLNEAKHHSGYTREWYNSIYSYDKTYVKNLIYKDNLVKYLFKSYFNLRFLTNKQKDRLKLKRIKNTRFSNKKVLLSKTEIKHTNNKVIFTIFVFNNNNRKYFNILKKLAKKNYLKNINILFQEFKYLKDQLITTKDGNKPNLKKVYYILYGNLINKKLQYQNYFSKLVYNLIHFYVYYEINITKFYKDYYYPGRGFMSILNSYNPYYRIRWSRKFKKFNRKYLRRIYRYLKKLKSLLYFNQIISFNSFKFTNLFLNYKGFGLINILSKIYNKKIEFNIVNLKSVHLNSNILTESIAVKISNRKNNMLNILRKVLQMVKLPSWILYFVHKSNNYENKKNILNSIRYKNISGLRFEASGRLTRRLIASRSVYKVRNKGSVKNIYSSYKGIPSVLLRGYIKSNIQYTLVNSTSRNGSFGLKGWIGSY